MTSLTEESLTQLNAEVAVPEGPHHRRRAVITGLYRLTAEPERVLEMLRAPVCTPRGS